MPQKALLTYSVRGAFHNDLVLDRLVIRERVLFGILRAEINER